MEIGMLWYDDDHKRTLEEKVRRAATYYREKHGQMPNLCVINPRTASNGAGQALQDIELRLAPNVLLHHFWVGVAKATQ